MIEIKVPPGIEGFVEDKDLAKSLRTEKIIPALNNGERVVIDFSNVKYATQSFVHTLVSEALRRFGEPALDDIEFRNCSQQLKNVIELVVDYSFTSFIEQEATEPAELGGEI
jgi:hypothetical protein